jgi:glycosyltransferase involved in cell wall biosynthesis
LFAPDPLKSLDDPSIKAQFDEYRSAFSALKAAISNNTKISVYCEVPEMAEVYSKIIGLEVEVAAAPNLVRTTGTGRRRLSETAISVPKIACIGHANEAKGYRFLPEAARLVLCSDANATFHIHGTLEHTNARGDRHVFEELSKLGPRVVTNTKILTSDEYHSWLLQADLVLLPYDEEVYKTRGSGVFNEARQMGIPVVASRGCAFARPAFEGGWGVAIAERTAKGIADALLVALADLPNLATQAEIAANKDGIEGTKSILARSIANDTREEQLLRSAAHRRFRRVDRLRLMVQQKYWSLVQKRAD